MSEEVREVKGIPITIGDWIIDRETSSKIISMLGEDIPEEHLRGSKIVVSGRKLADLKVLGVSKGIASYEDEEATSYSEKGTLYLQSYRDLPHEMGHHVYSNYLTGKQRKRVSTLCSKARRSGSLYGVEWDSEPSEFFASAYACYLHKRNPKGTGRDSTYYSNILSTTYKGMTRLLDEVFRSTV